MQTKQFGRVFIHDRPIQNVKRKDVNAKSWFEDYIEKRGGSELYSSKRRRKKMPRNIIDSNVCMMQGKVYKNIQRSDQTIARVGTRSSRYLKSL